jgi:predicted RNA-binding Zn ribbon-like protein
MASREDGQLQEAPSPLETVRQFLNTWDSEFDREELASTDDLGRWLVGQGLLESPNPQVEPGEFDRALELREALRSLATGHATGVEPDPAALLVLNGVLARSRVEVRLGADGAPSLVPNGESALSADLALGRLAALVSLAAFDGSWQRLKACPECGWSIYDRSKNRSRSWCRMSECGNRAKARAFRARKAASAPVTSMNADDQDG